MPSDIRKSVRSYQCLTFPPWSHTETNADQVRGNPECHLLSTDRVSLHYSCR
jgi:hypothetical protein